MIGDFSVHAEPVEAFLGFFSRINALPRPRIFEGGTKNTQGSDIILLNFVTFVVSPVPSSLRFLRDLSSFAFAQDKLCGEIIPSDTRSGQALRLPLHDLTLCHLYYHPKTNTNMFVTACRLNIPEVEGSLMRKFLAPRSQSDRPEACHPERMRGI